MDGPEKVIEERCAVPRVRAVGWYRSAMTRSFSHLLRNTAIWTAALFALFVAALIVEGAAFAAAVTFAVVIPWAFAVPFVAICQEQKNLPFSHRGTNRTPPGPPR